MCVQVMQDKFNIPGVFHRDLDDATPTSWFCVMEDPEAKFLLAFPDGQFSFLIQDGDIAIFESRYLIHNGVHSVGNPQRYYGTFYTGGDLCKMPFSSKPPPPVAVELASRW